MIKPTFNTAAINKQIERFNEKVETAIINILQRRGEQFVNDCRNDRTYQDQTGNLRASIGYFIFKGSEVIAADGDEIAESVCDVVDKKPGHYYLIGVAGMNYAAAVESKGYNVISNQSLQILPLIEGDFKDLQNKLKS